MVAVSRASWPCSQNQALASSWEWKKKKKKRHLKLNLKMCFFWKPGCAAINQGRHFHAPHFSWFLSEFPPFLSHSTLAPVLPTAAPAQPTANRALTAGWPQHRPLVSPPAQVIASGLSLEGSRTRNIHAVWALCRESTRSHAFLLYNECQRSSRGHTRENSIVLDWHCVIWCD